MEFKYYKKYNEAVYKKTLNNGLKVILIPKKDFHKTFITFGVTYGGADLSFIPTGKKNKVIQPAGIAHFLEHLLFKMPDGSDAFFKLNSLGVNSNAFTSFDKTVYLINGTENIAESLEYLLDFVQTPYFTDQTIKNERDIIKEEIKMYLDDVNSKLYNKLLTNTYKNNYLKEGVLGSVESINKIAKNDLYTAYDTFYHPANMSLIITGNFEKEKYLKIIEDNQAKKDYKKRENIKRIKPYEPKKVVIKDSLEKVNITTPLVGVGIKFSENENLKEQYIKQIKLGLLFDYYFSNSGEIYETLLKEELIDGSFSYYNDSLSVHFNSYTNKPKEFINFLRKVLINLKRRKFQPERFNMIKRSTYGSFIKSLNSVEGINLSYLETMSYEIELFNLPKIITDITLSDVFSLTKEINSDVITSYTLFPKKA